MTVARFAVSFDEDLARAFAAVGVKVLGFDVDAKKVERLNRGQSYIQQIPDAAIAEMRKARFEATGRFERLHEPDAILICVPTTLTEAREPDLTDFVYFAFTMGMTFQTSDCEITSQRMRQVSLAHSFLSYIFSIGVIAFTINALGASS